LSCALVVRWRNLHGPPLVRPDSTCRSGAQSAAPRFSGWIGEKAVSARLNRLFPAVCNDLILPDGYGGFTQIDYLALTPRRLLVVETKTYRGMILACANEPTWPQVIGRERHSFQNPLRQNDAQVRALEAVVLGIRVECRVVFAGNARSPKGMPASVCHASTLADEVSPLRQGEVSAQLCAAWDRVIAIDRTDRAAHQEHLRGLQTRHGGVRRIWVPVALLAGSVLWLSVSMDIHGTATHRLAGSAAAPTENDGRAVLVDRHSPRPSPVSSVPEPDPKNRDTLRAVNRPTQSPPERIAMIEWAPPHAG
jgi:restriction system protein